MVSIGDPSAWVTLDDILWNRGPMLERVHIYHELEDTLMPVRHHWQLYTLMESSFPLLKKRGILSIGSGVGSYT